MLSNQINNENIKIYVILFLLIIAIILGLAIAFNFSVLTKVDTLRQYEKNFNAAIDSNDFQTAKYELKNMAVYKDLPKRYITSWEIKISNYVEEYEEKSGLEFNGL
jgi:Tfp pilus assembly protein PilO